MSCVPCSNLTLKYMLVDTKVKVCCLCMLCYNKVCAYLVHTIFKYRNLLYFVTAHYAFDKKKSRWWQFYNDPPLKVRSSARVSRPSRWPLWRPMRIGRESCCLGGHEPPINGEGNGGQARKSFLFTRRSLEAAAGKPRLLPLSDGPDF